MQLSDYLIAEEISAAAFARSIDVSHVSVLRYLNKGAVPRKEIMERIVAVTDGQVQANDFFAAPKDTAA